MKKLLILFVFIGIFLLSLTACDSFGGMTTICVHTYGAYSVKKEASCEASGTEVRTCTKCGKEDTRSLPMLGHDYGEVVKTPATCTEKGYNRRTCTRCLKSTAEALPALGHDFRVYEPYENATCTEERSEKSVCERCKKKEDIRFVPNSALGHSYQWVVEQDPSETNTGKQTQVCEVCEKKGVTSIIPPKNHEHVMSHYPAVSATCIKNGNVEYWYCTSCRKNYSTELGDFRDELVEVQTPFIEHAYEEDFRVDVLATPTGHGVMSRHCEVVGCSAVTEARDIHYLIYVPEKHPTCIEDGTVAYYYCSVATCDRYFSDDKAENEIFTIVGDPMTGDHPWATTYTEDVPPTHVSVGRESIHCTTPGCTAKKAGSERDIPKLLYPEWTDPVTFYDDKKHGAKL